ncbi:hypothetical protein ASG00_12545 [Microbacterium sp. Leaf351]|nr:hypothetical protein ASG00_12545 [Microbacterium sp. Leaf351]
MPSATAVTSSELSMRYDPSPTMTMTSRSSSRASSPRLTPRPPAISYPIVENAYSTWYPSGSRTRHSLWRSPGSEPAACTMTSAGADADCTAPMISGWPGRGASVAASARSTAASQTPFSCAVRAAYSADTSKPSSSIASSARVSRASATTAICVPCL